MNNKKNKEKIVIYKLKGGVPQLKVRLKKETVWLNQAQIVNLFQKTKQNISLHIQNIFKEKELNKKSVVKEYLTTASDGKQYMMKYYNLDVIISVGYRVKSNRGTQFRIWATRILKDHVIKGYSINEQRIKEQNDLLIELQKTANLMGKLLQTKDLTHDEAKGLLQVITDYSYALSILNEYDQNKLKIKNVTKRRKFIITYDFARKAINELGNQLSKKNESIRLFGIEKDDLFKSSLETIYQTFDGKPLYPSLEEKAGHLLYFITKNHLFIDGNKRIAAFIFVWYLNANKLLYKKDGTKLINDNALVALTLMIAESSPKDKDVIIRLIVNLINRNN